MGSAAADKAAKALTFGSLNSNLSPDTDSAADSSAETMESPNLSFNPEARRALASVTAVL